MKMRGHYQRRTKIVATIGPASATAAVITRLIRAGMNVARFNLSHGTPEDHARYIGTVRNISRRLGINVAILIDLPGPKYRIGPLKDGQAQLRKGSYIRLTTADIEGDSQVLPVNLPTIINDIKVGDTVILDDGAMQLRVREVNGNEVKCRIVVGGKLLPGKGLVVPGMRISAPFLSDHLRENMKFAVSQKPDFLALSFVTGAENVTDVRDWLKENGVEMPLISKIERGEAVKNLSKILAVSDGIMVARGDLGVEIALNRVPLVQKEIIRKCNRAGKPVITATEMLESMINSVRPTRAETTDVANAIFDGTDAVMLSAETSVGKYPVVAVRMMAGIARAAEKTLDYERILAERLDWLERVTDELISYSACQTAYSLQAAAIVAFTQSGSTAFRIAKYRPSVPVLALTPSQVVAGRLMLYWGVRPYLIEEPSSVDAVFALGAGLARNLEVARPGDLIIIAAGLPIGEAGSTNMLKVEKISV
jgi:pyruvate kinase